MADIYAADGSISGSTDTTVTAFETVSGYESDAKVTKSFKYPLYEQPSHYVKFWINVDEESSIFAGTTPLVPDLGYVDNSKQNRLNRSLTDRSAIIAGGGAAVGALALTSKKAKVLMDKVFSGKQSAQVAAGIATVGAGVIAGTSVGALAVDNLKLTKRLKRIAQTIQLYMPAGIMSNYEIGWSEIDRNEALLVELTQKDNVDAIKKAATTGGGLADGLAGAARAVAVSASDAASVLSRTAVNPRKDMLFKDVGNRSFHFEYQFASRSKEEAAMVDQIIFMFKYYSHPEMVEGFGQFLFVYPAEFDIEYYFVDMDGKHKINPFLNKISSCVLESVSVSYASNGSYQSLLNGEPTIVNLRLRFKEIEKLHADRIKNGY